MIHPQLPLRMPCYDFTLIIDPTVVPGLTRGLRVLPTLLVWRAVSTRSENVFTGAFWSPITSKSNFKESSCRLLSELGPVFWDWLRLAAWQPSVPAIVSRVSPRVSKGHADLTSSPPSSQTTKHKCFNFQLTTYNLQQNSVVSCLLLVVCQSALMRFSLGSLAWHV